ncbi:MAG TPA: ATP-binding cassette domain-containing protein [Pirellulales bacterium]|nr:ATP-binding cassette domain-containing protein [Pirellulales bacterium]
MPLVTVSDLSIGFRGRTLLDAISCQIEPGQRIALLGRNGEGKTTFMRLLCGQIEPDSGQIAHAATVKIAILPQDVPQDIAGTIREVVALGLLNREAEPEMAWRDEQQIDRILAEMELPAADRFETLSSGMKRRVLLARALVSSPDLLLLDEPTNHLDIDAIRWLEEFLERLSTTLIFVTHDRVFLRRLATRILEIDRGRLFDWSCDYDTFLTRKEDWLAAEEKQNALFDKRLAEEEAWLRQGIKARRTRNEGRVRALEQMRRVRRDRPTAVGKVNLVIADAQRSGTLVAELDSVTFGYGERTIVPDFSATILRGDKIGIFGPNGAGKTTLLRLLLRQLEPDSGNVRLGTNLQIAYFDQLRQQLNPEASVQENVGDGYDTVTIAGKSRHVIGYLEEFLFSPERSRTPVRFLSGGECNRVLLAKLFAKPANVIVLDEPTNDLDAETLELLEERLVQFSGTVLVVSHDRAFLNNVVTSTYVFEDGQVREYVGGYDDWQRQRAASIAATAPPPRPSASTSPKERSSSSADAKAGTPKRRLSFKERQELQTLPQTIEQLEGEISTLHQAMAQEDFYRQPGKQIAEQQARLKELEVRLAESYERWEQLDQFAE